MTQARQSCSALNIMQHSGHTLTNSPMLLLFRRERIMVKPARAYLLSVYDKTTATFLIKGKEYDNKYCSR